MQPPNDPKIYHIVHVDKLPSIIKHGLLCDSEVVRRMNDGLAHNMGTTIGKSGIKERRLHHLTLDSHPDLHVGECVPFYFCPRSVMLYMIHRANNPELSYRGGQEPIVHLEADMRCVVDWADNNDRRWAFTESNAGSSYFMDYAGLDCLDQLDWEAINATSWRNDKDKKQAEFLLEQSLDWGLVDKIGVNSRKAYDRVCDALQISDHKPEVGIESNWYY